MVSRRVLVGPRNAGLDDNASGNGGAWSGVEREEGIEACGIEARLETKLLNRFDGSTMITW